MTEVEKVLSSSTTPMAWGDAWSQSTAEGCRTLQFRYEVYPNKIFIKFVGYAHDRKFGSFFNAVDIEAFTIGAAAAVRCATAERDRINNGKKKVPYQCMRCTETLDIDSYKSLGNESYLCGKCADEGWG